LPRSLVPTLYLTAALSLPIYAAQPQDDPAPGATVAVEATTVGQNEPAITASNAIRVTTPLRLVLAPDRAITRGYARQLDDTRLAPSLAGPSAALVLRHAHDYPQQNGRSNQNWGRALTDIARHLPAGARYQDAYLRYTQAGDLVTAGHEWTHFLNEVLASKAGVGKSSFYVLDDKYVTLSDPEGLRGIVPQVPSSLRGDLYDLYLVQNSSNARVDPLYLFDEWTAYANDVTVAVDQLEHGKPLDVFRSDLVQTRTAGNVLEFMFYGFAVGMAVRAYDPAYYASENGTLLRDFIAFNARRSMDIYNKALQQQTLSHGDPRNTVLIRNFRASPDTAALRAWVKRDLGDDLARLLDAIPGAPVARSAVPSPVAYRKPM
jgi:hypothetical protein